MNLAPQSPYVLIRLALVALAGVLGLAGVGFVCLAALHGLSGLLPAPLAAAMLGAVLLILSGATIAALDHRAGPVMSPQTLPAPAETAALAAFLVAFLLSRRLSRRG